MREAEFSLPAPDLPRPNPLRSSFILLFLFALISSSLQAEQLKSVPPSQLEKVAYSNAWLRLSYFEKGLFGYQSRITAKDFFLAESGDRNPLLELKASLQGFLSTKIIRDKQTTQCVYPARYSLLKKAFAKWIHFTDQECERLNIWRSQLNAESVTLIYPGTYQNNPASMFGHTLLRLDQPGQTDETRMLSYSVNYAAETLGLGGVLYAFNGLLGGFDGFFSVSPYYKMLNKYSDLESRDIWEYTLSYTPEEIKFLTLHLWELKQTPFTYYYFDENCSYQLLALLEVIRPEVDLTSRFKIHVLPVDTVRAVLDQKGMLKEVHFRPSSGSKVTLQASKLPRSVQEQTKEYVAGDSSALKGLDEYTKVQALELAYDTIEFKRLKTAGDTSKEEKQLLTILRERSALPDNEERNATVVIPTERSPHEGHRTARSRGEYRYEYDASMIHFALRPAYHDTLDFSEGYTSGFGIDFLEVGFRWHEKSGFQFDKLQVLKVESLTPRTVFFKPISWRFSTGVERHYFEERDDSLQYQNQLAAGASFATPIGLLSILPEVQSPIAAHYRDGIDVQGGVYVSLLNDAGTLALKPEGRSFVSLLNESDWQHELSLPVRIALGTNSAVRIGISRVWQTELHFNKFGVSYDYFW